ncbi:MAG: DNA cytosine methyltransferase [Cyanophyceae cyanobacterium]
MTQRPIAIDLFAGAGGLSLGFEQAGFDVAIAVEIDPVHGLVHHFNFAQWVTLPRSVKDVTGKELREKVREQFGGDREIDVVVGGAPCQGFSLIGQRALDDPRNLLVKEFLRIVREVQPKYFLFENVKGLTIGRHRQFLQELIEAAEGADYQVVQPWQVLNAADYGVPQKRERLFLLGAQRGLPQPDYPQPLETSDRPTCADALEDLPDAETFTRLRDRDAVTLKAPPAPTSAYGREMRCDAPDDWHFGYQRQWNPQRLTGSWRTNHTSKIRDRFRQTQPGTIDKPSRFLKLDPDGVANTLRAGTDSARGAFTSPRPIHYKYNRCVTVREMARLHGFPDWFRLHSTKWHGARQIGNSVPPPLARAIAAEIIKALGHQPTCPETVHKLGDQSLLSMDISAACRHWDIENPIAPRSRPSLSVPADSSD